VIVISVSLRVPEADMEAFRRLTEELVQQSRLELGVLAYSFAVDLLEPTLIRIFEVYADQAALDAHHASVHFQAWRPRSTAYMREERWLLDATRRT
jgi:quinol monooxygenase YgiN